MVDVKDPHRSGRRIQPSRSDRSTNPARLDGCYFVKVTVKKPVYVRPMHDWPIRLGPGNGVLFIACIPGQSCKRRTRDPDRMRGGDLGERTPRAREKSNSDLRAASDVLEDRKLRES